MQTQTTHNGNVPFAVELPVAREVAALPSNVFLPTARLVQRLPMPMPRWRALLELFVVAPVGLFFMTLIYSILNLFSHHAGPWPQVADNIIPGISLLIVGLLVLRLAGHHCRTIGWTRRKWFVNTVIGLASLIPTYLILFCAGMILMLISPGLMEKQIETQERIKEVIPDMPFPVIALLMIWVTFWEEFIFRGFLLTRLHALCRRWWLTVPAGALFFGLLHLWQGPVAAVVIGLLGLVMGTLFAWRKSLIPGWAFHFAHNVLIVQLIHSELINLPG